MKKNVKLLAVLVVISIFSSLLAGCTSDEKTFYDAVLKSGKINSMETKTDLSLRVNVTNISEEEKQDPQIQSLLRMLNDLKVSVDQKTVRNEAQTVIKSQADISANMGGMGINTTLWVDSDMSGEIPVLKEIFKIPMIAAIALPEEYRNKQYLVYDFSKVLADSSLDSVDFSKSIAAATEFQSNFTQFLKDYALEYNPGLELVKRNGTTVVGNETLPVYQLKMDDAAFKHVLKYSAIDLLSNEKAIQLMKDYMVDLAGIMPSEAGTSEDISGKIDEYFQDYTNNIPELITQINSFFDALDKVKLIGDKGIVINYAIKNGYIVSESGSVDIVIDTKALDEAFKEILDDSLMETPAILDEMPGLALPETEDQTLPVIELGFDYSTATSSINQNVAVDFPELTEANSVTFEQLAKAAADDIYTGGTPELPPVTGNNANVVIDGVLLQSDASPRIINGRVLVPARAVSEALGCEVNWDAQYGIATFTNDYAEVIVQKGSTSAFVNGEERTLDVPAEIYEDRIFVPLRFISEGLGGYVDWDDQQKTAIIYSY